MKHQSSMSMWMVEGQGLWGLHVKLKIKSTNHICALKATKVNISNVNYDILGLFWLLDCYLWEDTDEFSWSGTIHLH